jgi:muramidase (phage lysozyme)
MGARLAMLLLICAALATPAQARDQRLLNFIASVESRGDYDALYHGLRQRPARPLTQLTVGEVMQFQRSLRNVTSTAVGRYQFIKDTLAYLARKHRIDPKTRFDAALQDRLAWELVRECAAAPRPAGLCQLSGANLGRLATGVWAKLWPVPLRWDRRK